ncbi:MAG: hypothetical protein JO112_18410, partial [Planctomycetes bacterium]|nr:hypothetical protein [Planctomycetota bacterium]
MLPATDPLPARIDITQPPYKAIPGTDCAPAFQAACDDCRADGRPHVIYIPGNAAPYLLNQPIFADADNLAFVGDGERLSVIRVNGQCFPDALQFGVRQTSIKVTASGMHIDQTLTPVSDFWIDA